MGKRIDEAQRRTLKKVLRYMKPYRFFLLLSLLLAAVTVAGTLYLPLLIGNAVDCIIGPGSVDFDGVFRVLFKMGLVIGVTALSQWLMNVCNNKLTYQIVRDVRNEAFTKLEILPLKYIDSHPHGEIVSRVIADVDQFADGLLMGFTQLFSGVITILGTLAFMFSVNVSITLVVLVVTPVSLLVASFIAKRTFKMFKVQSETRGEQTALIEEMIGGQKVVQAFGHEKETLEKFDEINGRLQGCSLKAIFFSSLTNPATRFVNSLVYTGVGIFGALAAIQGRLTVGQLSSFLSYANQYTKPFNEISGVVTELQNAIACAGRVFGLIEEEPQTPEKEDAVSLSGIDGRVELKDVSFSMKKGEVLALAGESGCGKSTLAKVILGLKKADSGTVEHFGNRPQMVFQDPYSSLNPAKRIGWILEEPLKNRGGFSAQERHSRAVDMLKRVGLDEKIADRYPNQLSGGQRQRVCIGAALMAEPGFLVADEAVSALDVTVQAQILELLEKLKKEMGLSILFISHDMRVIYQISDRVMIMQGGRIVESGRVEEVYEGPKAPYTKELLEAAGIGEEQ